MLPSHIVLLGFMGAGKSSVGQELARLLGYPFLDLDRAIEAREEMTIPHIFSERGEQSFRKLEREVLTHLLKAHPEAVIAIGGGAYTQPEVRQILGSAQTIHLNAPFTELMERCGPKRESRPLLRDLDKARKLYEQRQSIYALADWTLETGERSISEVAEEIYQRLRR